MSSPCSVAVGVGQGDRVTLSLVGQDKGQWCTTAMTPTHARFVASQLIAAANAIEEPKKEK